MPLISGQRALPKPKRINREEVAVCLAAGDPLPKGEFRRGWKLDAKLYGQDVLYLIYVPAESSKPA